MANLSINPDLFFSRFTSGWRFVLSLFAVVVILKIPTFFTGFYNPDETCYATIAARILEGKLLYRDIIDHKPPAIYYLYSLFVLIGKNYAIYVAHAAMVFIVAATAFVIKEIAGLIICPPPSGSLPQGEGVFEHKKLVPILAAVLYVIGASLGKPNDVAAANAELIFNLPLSLFVYFALRAWDESWKEDSPAALAIAGLMAGLAVLIKPQAVFAVPAVIIFLLVDARQGILRRLANGALVAAFTLVPVAVVAINLYYAGVLDDAIYWGFSVNSLYMQGHESGAALILRFIKQTSYMLFAEEGAFWFPLILWVILKKKGESLLPKNGFIILLWLAFSALAVIPGFRFYGHYYLQMLPPLSIMAAAAITRLLVVIPVPDSGARGQAPAGIQTETGFPTKSFGNDKRRKIVLAVLCVLVVVPLMHSWIWAWPIQGFRTTVESEENKLLVEYLNLATGPNQKIEVWGRFNGIPFLADRENGTRFLNKNLLAGSFRSEELVKMPDSHWRLYFYDLERNRPEWFVDHSGVDMKDAPLTKFPRLSSYILSNYNQVAEVSGNKIYRRK